MHPFFGRNLTALVPTQPSSHRTLAFHGLLYLEANRLDAAFLAGTLLQPPHGRIWQSWGRHQSRCICLQIVLVNGGTASTAELIAASLHDNHRAALVGEKTFGKGRTQRIVQLKGGGLLLLSNTVYLTPQHQPVDKVHFFTI